MSRGRAGASGRRKAIWMDISRPPERPMRARRTAAALQPPGTPPTTAPSWRAAADSWPSGPRSAHAGGGAATLAQDALQLLLLGRGDLLGARRLAENARPGLRRRRRRRLGTPRAEPPERERNAD